MKTSLLALTLTLSGLSLFTPAFAHDDEYRVGIEINGSLIQNAGPQTFAFDLIDLKTKEVLADSSLNILHEKKLHVFVFDEALIEFKHEHPEYIDGQWVLSVNLPRTGNYWVWMQGELASDGSEFSSPAKITIKQGLPAHPTPASLPEMRSNVDGTSRVTFPNKRIVAKKHTMFNIKFSRTDGTAVSLTPWLGANAHVVSVLSDGDTLVHVHPSATGQPDELMIHAEFPYAGHYRVWVQFIDGGVLKTIPLAIEVFKQ